MKVSTPFAKRRGVVALTGVALASVAMVSFLAFFAGSAQAQSGTAFTAARGTVTRISSGTTLPQSVLLNVDSFVCMNMTDLPDPAAGCDTGDDDDNAPTLPNGPLPNTPFNGGLTKATGKAAPNVPSVGRGGAGAPVANFNGIYDAQNVPLIGGHVTPPDQGLCVGPASAFPVDLGVPGHTSIVIEAVNEAFTVYDTSGNTLFGPDSLADLFSDPFASGDVSCNYDPGTHSFFFTEIGAVFEGDNGFFGTGIAVTNANGYAAYALDSAEGGNCLPDFPQQGFNDNAFYISVREFCGANEDFEGASLYGLSKSQLAGLSSNVNVASFSRFVDGAGIPVDGLRPAIGDGTNTEYLLNAIAYDATGNSTNASNLDLWRLTGGQNITSGSGTISLSEQSVPTEPYAYPVDAASTGDGSCSFHNGQCEITSESFLDPVDSRVEQVQFVNAGGAPGLYTSLDSALTVGNDPTPVDGAAWFNINPTTGKVIHQGYVALAGTNLLDPSMVRSGSGTLNMGFSMTSPTLNPSTGYVVSKNQGNSFGPVQTTGEGYGPHLSYSPIVFGRHRWGDYSAVALDPVTGNVWMADEYTFDQGSDPADNWGTRVWGLKG
jgi:hypothetical protein